VLTCTKKSKVMAFGGGRLDLGVQVHTKGLSWSWWITLDILG